MANKRMFEISTVDTDRFLEMPLGAQALYFHLGIRADDDGFIGNPKKIQSSINASDDDVKILIAKGFIRVFETGVIVVSHWNIHNSIKKDRYKRTVYKKEYDMLELDENKCYIFSSENGKNKKTLSLKMEPKRSPSIDLDLDLDLEKNNYKKSEPVETNQKSNSCSSENKNLKDFEEWILIKSKNKINPSAYAATLKRKFLKKEQSVIDEFNYWLNQKTFNSALENAIGKTILTRDGDKTILCVEPKDGELHVAFVESGFTIIPDISTLNKIITQQNQNKEIK